MDNYTIGKKISEGAFGTVYSATSNLLPNTSLAIKQIYKSPNTERELSILKQLPPHPNLVHIYDIVAQNEIERSIVMERGLHDLHSLIQSLSYPINEGMVKVVARGLLQALKHLHAHKIIHRDLKPSNVLVKEGLQDVVVCDLGSAVQCSEGEEYALEGFTRWYKAPEMLFGSRTYQYEVDVWSLGCILMELASGDVFFPGKSQIEQLALIGNVLGEPSVENWPSIVKLQDYGKINFAKKPIKTFQQISEERSISLPLTKFIMKMIRYDNRASIEELLQDPYLEHIQNSSLELGIFNEVKIKQKIFY